MGRLSAANTRRIFHLRIIDLPRRGTARGHQRRWRHRAVLARHRDARARRRSALGLEDAALPRPHRYSPALTGSARTPDRWQRERRLPEPECSLLFSALLPASRLRRSTALSNQLRSVDSAPSRRGLWRIARLLWLESTRNRKPERSQ